MSQIITITARCSWCGQHHAMPAVNFFCYPKRWRKHPPTAEQIAARIERMRRNRTGPMAALADTLAAANLCAAMKEKVDSP